MCQFNKGDFVYRELRSNSKWLSIHKCIDETDTRGDIISFADMTVNTKGYPYKSFDVWPLCFQTNVLVERLATEDEKQMLLDCIDKNGYTWDAENFEIKPKIK